jgi:OFA family oxalate/formate antiporter-like MFS transporter
LRFLIAAALLFCGFFITSRINPGELLKLYIAYGFMSGIGIGFVYTTVIGLTNAWFPDKPGICSGMMLAGFGLTSLVIGNLAKKFMQMPAIGWRTTYLILGIALGVLFLTASFIIRAPKEGAILPKRKVSKKSSSGTDEVHDYAPSELIKRSSFWRLFFVITLIAAVGSAAIALAVDIFIDFGFEQGDAATLFGIIAVFNGVGRLTLGALFDAIGIRKSQMFIAIVALLAPATVVVAILSGSMVVGVIGIALCCFAYGFAPTMASVFAMKFYGPKNFSLNLSILNLILIPAPFAATLAATMRESTESFLIPFAILACCAVVGGAINLSIKKA